MTDRELMQQAYAVPLHEKLASVPVDARLVIDDPDGIGTRYIPVGRMCHEAAAALRERLAQPEQSTKKHEPKIDLGRYAGTYGGYVATQSEQKPVAWMCSDFDLMHRGYSRFSPTRQGDWNIPVYTTPPRCPNCASLEAQNTELDAKLAEYERREQPEQEPVAWNLRYNRYPRESDLLADIHLIRWRESLPQSLNTPQPRQWVGLTDEDKQIAFDDTQEGGGFWEFADAIEAKLREKNWGNT